MGNESSTQNADCEKVPLMTDTDDNDVIIQDLRLVLIGGDGKNAAGNIILGQKEFTILTTLWTLLKNTHVEINHDICKRHITLIRTPGSFRDLSCSHSLRKDNVVHCVRSLFSPGPHVILLVIPIGSVDSMLLERTRVALNTLFTDKVWDHTMVLFIGGENMSVSIDDYIISNNLSDFMKQCKDRYYILYTNKAAKDQCIELMKTLEDMVAENEDTYLCLRQDRELNSQDLIKEIEKIKTGLNNKVRYLEKASSDSNWKAHNDSKSYKVTIKSKDDEIKRLKKIIADKDMLIERLKAGQTDTQTEKECQRCKEKDQQIQHLQEEGKKKDQQIQSLKTEVAKLKAQKNTTDQTSEDTLKLEDQRSTHMDCEKEIYTVPSEEQMFEREWRETLYQILMELNNEDFDLMKFHMHEMPKGIREHATKLKTIDWMIQYWGVKGSIKQTDLIMEKISHNEEAVQSPLRSFLAKI